MTGSPTHPLRPAVLCTALVCSAACSAANLGGPGGGGAGGNGGVSGNAAAAGIGGAGAMEGVPAVAGQACDAPATCSCDGLSPECQPLVASLCLGQHCPPSLDDAMLVANWTLRSSMGSSDPSDPPGPHGSYSECSDGSRTFFYYVPTTGLGFSFGFDVNGQLAWWSTFDGRVDAGACSSTIVCGSTKSSSLATCSSCETLADPPPAGSQMLPQGLNNGPPPICEIDADGRWSIP